jgi:hypothetical protein
VAFVAKQNKISAHTDETSMKAANYAPDVLRKIKVEQFHLLQRLHQCMNVKELMVLRALYNQAKHTHSHVHGNGVQGWVNREADACTVLGHSRCTIQERESLHGLRLPICVELEYMASCAQLEAHGPCDTCDTCGLERQE